MKTSTSTIFEEDLASARSDSYSLTSSQREIWFDQAIHERSSMYNIGGYIRIAGAVDPQHPIEDAAMVFRRSATLAALGWSLLRKQWL